MSVLILEAKKCIMRILKAHISKDIKLWMRGYFSRAITILKIFAWGCLGVLLSQRGWGKGKLKFDQLDEIYQVICSIKDT